MSETKIEFKVQSLADAIRSTASGSVRRDAATRQKMVNEFAPGATLVGVIGIENATKLINGATTKLGDLEMSIAKPETLACHLCGGVHGAPRGHSSQWSAERLGMTLVILLKTGKYILLSRSCLDTYVLDSGAYRKFANADVIKAAFRL